MKGGGGGGGGAFDYCRVEKIWKFGSLFFFFISCIDRTLDYDKLTNKCLIDTEFWFDLLVIEAHVGVWNYIHCARLLGNRNNMFLFQ